MKLFKRLTLITAALAFAAALPLSVATPASAYATGGTFLYNEGGYSTSKSPVITFDVPTQCSDARVEIYNDNGFYRAFNSNTTNTGQVRNNPAYPSLKYTFILDLAASYNNVVLANGIYHISLMSACGSPYGYGNPTYFDQYLDAMGIFPVACNDPATNTSYCAPLHRFYNTQTGAHFYTSDEHEKRIVLGYPQFRYEGITAFVQTQSAADKVTVWRFYNKNTGTHFYTANQAEANNVMNYQWQTYNYEGAKYAAYPNQPSGTTAFFRFYKYKQGVHFYTSSYVEYQNVLNTMQSEYRYEGIAYYNIINQ